MAKKTPIKVVNTSGKKQAPPVKKKTASTSSRKGKNRNQKSMPLSGSSSRWIVISVACLIVLFFSGIFYYWFIRPYSYRWKPCYGFREYGICMPFGYQTHGIDISHYQGDIDWEMIKIAQSDRYPIQFVFMKATEGGDLNDHTFERNFEAARQHGFIRGAYHFYNPSTPPLKQAEFYINTVKLEEGDLPPVLDIEILGKKKPHEIKKDIRIWLDTIEAHYQVKPILYTSYRFKTRYLNDSIFNTYPYWIAHYYVDSVQYEGEWNFWQHTDVGIVPGIPEKVDLNIFNGSLKELKELTLKKKKI